MVGFHCTCTKARHQHPTNKPGLGWKQELGQVGFQFDLLNTPNLLVAPTPKTTAITCLSCQLHRLISYVARHVIKCVAVIEKVNYLKNCGCVFTYVYKYPFDTVEALDSTLLLSRQLFFQLISVFSHTCRYASKHHLNFMLVPELQHCQSNCIKQFFFGIPVFIHYRNAPIDNWRSWKMT